MNLPDISFTNPFEFLSCAAGPTWAAWILAAWAALMVAIGVIGTVRLMR